MAKTAKAVLRLPTVMNRCGISRSFIYARMRTGDFPRPIPIGKRAVAWLESEIENWLAAKVKAARPVQRPVRKAFLPVGTP